MKTKKALALILSILMIVTMLPTNIFAAPAAVTVVDTAQEIHVHQEHEHEHEEEATAELAAIIDKNKLNEVYKTFDNGFYINYDVYTVCNTCKSYVYVMNDYDHSIYIDTISADFSTPGNARFTFVFTFFDCKGQTYSSEPKTQTISFNCAEKVYPTVFAKVNGQYAYMFIRRDASSHTGGNPTCKTADNCTRCNASYTIDHSYSSSYTQIVDGTTYKHRRMCTYDCGNYVDEGTCSGGKATCKDKAVCTVCKNTYGDYDTTNHDSKSVNEAKGIYCAHCELYEQPSTTTIDGVTYYEINNAGKLYWFAQEVNSGNVEINGVLTNDIVINEGNVSECGGTMADGWFNWAPIASGDSNPNFNGIFDGKEHTISGIYGVSGSVQGLFGNIGENGTVKNVGVINSYFDTTTQSNAGGIAANNFGTIENCYNTGSVNGGQHVGGVVGNHENGTVSNCYNTGYVVGGRAGNIGGVVGQVVNVGVVENCYNTGNVYGAYTGGGIVGLLGSAYVRMRNCYNTGNVSGGSRIGGVAAGIASASNIENCYFNSENFDGNAVGNVNDGSVVEDLGKTSAEFASGEVAYLLNNGVTDGTQAYFQTVGEGIPTFEGETVYYGYESCLSTEKIYSNTALYETIPEHTDENPADHICDICKNVLSECVDEDSDHVCDICGETASECADEDGDYRCDVCGAVINNIVISMTDSFRDSWNGAFIEIYENGVLYDTVTVDGEKNTYYITRNPISIYTFVWKKGRYDNECSFEITVDGESVFAIVGNDLNNTEDGTVLFTIESNCEHSIPEGSLVCSVCSRTCGTDFSHRFDENSVCTLCKTACGTEENPHSYENGHCIICKSECSHNFEDNVCSICSVKKVYTVETEDKTHFFEDFEAAVLFAGENEGSTLTLYDNVDFGEDGYTIQEGNFTLDLNGFKITSSTHTLTITGETHLTVCDSSQEKTGRIETTSRSNNAIILYGYPKLTLDSGTVYGPFRAIDMSDTGWETNAALEINGGKVIVENESGHAITANGDSVIINGGEIKGLIVHHSGTVDLSGHPNPAGIGIWIQSDEDLSADEYNLPDGYCFLGEDGERADVLEAYGQYTVASTPIIENPVAQVIEPDGTITEHTTIEAAIAKASENVGSTLKLLDNISLSYDVSIWGGKFTIDLNGKTWHSTTDVITAHNSADIKIIDSSENGDGTMSTDSYSAIRLWNSSKLEIASGNFSCYGNFFVDTSTSNIKTSSELLISGGKFVGTCFANVYGNKATITGGEFESEWEYFMLFEYGTLDLSNYTGTSELRMLIAYEAIVSDIELIVPEGTVLREYFKGYTVTAQEIMAGDTYIVEFPETSYVEIDLGERSDDTNVRYAEIGGVVTAIEENGDKYLVEIGEENLLIEFVEKTAGGEVVKSQYFYVDMTAKTATKLSMDSYMHSYDEKTIRIKDPMGMRFKSHILTFAKAEETEYVIDEYGYIIATKDALGEEELTLDFEKYAKGVGYNKADGTDIVFDGDDEQHIFTGVIKNMPVAHYKTDFVCKTYTKISVGGKQFVIYGEAVVGNVYDTAEKLLETNPDDADLLKIIFDYENSIGLPGDELYPEEA